MSGPRALEGKVALVSGAAGGIGRAVLAALAREGARTVGFDLQPAPEGSPVGDGGWIRGDIRKDADVERAVSGVVQFHGRLDLLVHAAGVTRDAVLWKLDVNDWDLVQEVNLRGAFLLMRHAVPAMRRSEGGRIVLIGSVNGSRGQFGLTAYAASKAGLLGLAKSAARETARFGILVNVVEPGMIRTPMTAGLPEEVLQTARAESLVGRLGVPEDVAQAVLFLCGSGAAYVTGQVLRVDGGQYL